MQSGSLDQLKDLSGFDDRGTSFFWAGGFDVGVEPNGVPFVGGGGPGGGGGAIGGAGGGGGGAGARVISFADVICTVVDPVVDVDSSSPSLSLASLALCNSSSSFSLVRSRFDWRSSFSCVLASISCSRFTSELARSEFSFSSSSARVRN